MKIYKELTDLLDEKDPGANYAIEEELSCFGEESVEKEEVAEKEKCRKIKDAPEFPNSEDVPILIVAEYTLGFAEKNKMKTGTAISLAQVLGQDFTLSNKCWMTTKSTAKTHVEGPVYNPSYHFFDYNNTIYIPHSIKTEKCKTMEDIIKLLKALRRHQLCF